MRTSASVLLQGHGRSEAAVSGRDLNDGDLAGVRKRRPQHDGVDDAEHRHVDARAERQHQHGHGGKAGRSTDRAERVLGIRPHAARVLADNRPHEAWQLAKDESGPIAGAAALGEVGLDGGGEIRPEVGGEQAHEGAEDFVDEGRRRPGQRVLRRSMRVDRAAATIAWSRSVSAATTSRPNGVSR